MKEKRMDVNFRKRLQRRLHYGDLASLDVPSLPLTELAVDYFHDSNPEKLGHVDVYSASNIIRRNHVSPCSLMLSMLYAKRLKQQKQKNKDLLQSVSSADVFFISMMVASKYLYDEGVEEEVFNDVWAENTDQNVDDVNKMEIDFLQAMDWNLFVRPQEFETTLSAIERRLALQEGLKRGWYTYTEMDLLMNSDLMWAMWTNVGSECSKLLTVISAAYLTSVLSLMGSAALAVQISGHLSSMTVALLMLQSSSLTGVVSTGLYPAVSARPIGFSMLSSHVYTESIEVNESEVNSPDVTIANQPQSAPLILDGNSHIRQDSLENSASVARQSQDNDKAVHVSIRSLWRFFNSLISQIWTVFCIKSQLAQCLDGSVSGKIIPLQEEPDSLTSVWLSDKHIPRFRRRERRHKNGILTEKTTTNQDGILTEKTTRNQDSMFTEKTTRKPNQFDHKPCIVAQDVCKSGKTVAKDQICSDDSPDLINWNFPVHDFFQTLATHYRDCEPFSRHLSQNSLLDNPTQLNSLDSVTNNVKDSSTQHNSLEHLPCPEKSKYHSRHSLSSVSNSMQPANNTCQFSQQFHPEIQIGFCASVSHGYAGHSISCFGF